MRSRHGTRRLWCAQITGDGVVPFDVAKQTALLSTLARNFPRLAFGFGLEQTQVVDVVDSAAEQTALATIITESGGDQQLVAEVSKPQREISPLPV